MQEYIPPFTITNEILDRISSIMKKIGQLDSYNNLNKMPILRKDNRIKSIHSSLAIEANSLSLEQVEDVIEGKLVIGPQKEIQEVKNAYNAYSKMNEFNPYSIEDLKKVHGIMTYLTVGEPGKFRKGNEGVFDEDGTCVHVCPPPNQINFLMKELFDWMKENKDRIHPLILSTVFHYEFVFIHPFEDGNGRTARLWQNVILSNWEKIFEYLPIESEIKKYQEEYYSAIKKCNISGESTLFIEFMLQMIDDVLTGLISDFDSQFNYTSDYVKKLLAVMIPGVQYTTYELMELLNMKSRSSFRNNYLIPAIQGEMIKMTYPDSATNKNQKYYKC